MESTEATHPIILVPEPAQRSLVKKLAAIMGEVERVQKNGRNASQGYDYATEADIAAAVREGMAKRAVMLIPSVLETTWEKIPTRSGGELKLCTLKVEFTLEDGESGETRRFNVMGQGTDNGDKATYKAMTGAEKYALMKLFLIPTGDDPEKDESPPPRQQQSKQAKPPAPAKEEKPAPTQAPAVRARITRLWKAAHAKGTDVERFQSWAAQHLRRNVPSVEWTEAEVAKLEELAKLPAEAQEPGGEG